MSFPKCDLESCLAVVIGLVLLECLLIGIADITEQLEIMHARIPDLTIIDSYIVSVL